MNKIGNFDIDGTLLYLPTKFFYKHKESGEIHEFEAHEIDQSINGYKREDYLPIHETNGNSRDFFLGLNSHRGFNGIQEDFKKAIEEGRFGPSFDLFKTQFLVKGRVFNLVTSRGNSPESFQKAFYDLNEKVLNKEEKEEQLENIIKNFNLNNSRDEALYEYFSSIIGYYPCSNPNVRRFLNIGDEGSKERKVIAFDHILRSHIEFLERTNKEKIDKILKGEKLEVSFYEDSVKNSRAILDRMIQIKENGLNINGNKIEGNNFTFINEFVGTDDGKEEIIKNYSNSLIGDNKIITII